MKIFQVINVRWFNATSWYALYLSQLLQDAGHDVLVITLADTETEAKALEMGLNVKTIDLNTTHPFKLARACAQVLSLVRNLKPDVVNCHRGESFFWWAILRKLRLGFKLVRTRGDQRLPKNDIINRYLHSKVADAVVATNKRMAGHFLEKMKLDQSRVWLIHGGVDNDRFTFSDKGRKEIREKFGFTDQHSVIGLLGRFDRVKGQKELIQAVGKIYNDYGYKDIRLLLLGYPTATSKREVDIWIEENNVKEITAISGKCTDVSACISALDIGVIASLWSETIARAALEIMACDRPLISTTVGVMPDLVPQSALIPPGDVPAMTVKLLDVLNDPALAAELLKKQKKTMSQLSGKDFLTRTLTLYTGIQDK
jgi:glycosyltransferase involved in cell wall biosynthesis